MYNQATQEIAKPSELLTSVRAYMTVLQSIENYVTIDITRVFNNVLLQQTQHLDSHGEPTITSLYTNWYVFLLFLSNTSNMFPLSLFSFTETLFHVITYTTTPQLIFIFMVNFMN